MAPRLTSKELLDRCDGFPYMNSHPERYARQMDKLYTLVWQDSEGVFPIGYMLKSVFDELKLVPPAVRGDMIFDPFSKTVRMFHRPATERKRTELAAATTRYLRLNQSFKILKGWRGELWPVYGRNGELLFSMERAAVALFGYMRYGVHLIAYAHCPTSPYGIKLWVPKRSQAKSQWPGMFDTTVAGGLTTDEDPFECVIREADEEASLPDQIVRDRARSAGLVKYIYVNDTRAGGSEGYVYPECQWVYDLELPDDIIPEPNDGEVESFMLCTVGEVKEQLAAGRWKPNCAVIMLDFFARMGILTRENEPQFDNIEARLRRQLPFPGPHDYEE
ncbi:NUDIX hydrolase domain-like protein [Diaporthe sp. PMI_573]|nr:NUDIX hydrolase domain-like protein [Diaporthaceae sp. PMI_573]